jgi:hypothetical protein
MISLGNLNLIGITGEAGSGKDSVANFLPRDTWCISLAEPLKYMLDVIYDIASRYTGYTVWDWDDREWKSSVNQDLGFSPRFAAQTLGTEWGRKILGEGFWIRLLEMNIIDLFQSGVSSSSYFVIPDVRFDNEAEWIKDRGGVIWQVKRARKFQQGETFRLHESENGINPDLIDKTINNNDTLEVLKEKVLELYNELQTSRLEKVGT